MPDMRTTLRIVLSGLAGLVTLLLLYPSVCADSGSAPCDTWIGTKVRELPILVLLLAVVGVGFAVWALLGFTPLGNRRDA
jgi:hypothetical protein